MLRIIRPTNRELRRIVGFLDVHPLSTLFFIFEPNGASAERQQRLQDLAVLLHPEPDLYPETLEPKSISPGFPLSIYCNFTLGNSK